MSNRTNLYDQERIIEFRKQGLTRKQIAEALGINQNTLNKRLKLMFKKGLINHLPKQEVKKRSQKANSVMNNEEIIQAKILRSEGLSLQEIATKFNVSEGTISNKVGSSRRITPLQQQLIELRLKGLTVDEVANELGKPRGTVGVILARLVKRGLLPSRKGCDPFAAKRAKEARLLLEEECNEN